MVSIFVQRIWRCTNHTPEGRNSFVSLGYNGTGVLLIDYVAASFEPYVFRRPEQPRRGGRECRGVHSHCCGLGQVVREVGRQRTHPTVALSSLTPRPSQTSPAVNARRKRRSGAQGDRWTDGRGRERGRDRAGKRCREGEAVPAGAHTCRRKNLRGGSGMPWRRPSSTFLASCACTDSSSEPRYAEPSTSAAFIFLIILDGFLPGSDMPRSSPGGAPYSGRHRGLL
jgi:hypothetical protein